MSHLLAAQQEQEAGAECHKHMARRSFPSQTLLSQGVTGDATSCLNTFPPATVSQLIRKRLSFSLIKPQLPLSGFRIWDS